MCVDKGTSKFSKGYEGGNQRGTSKYFVKKIMSNIQRKKNSNIFEPRGKKKNFIQFCA